MGDMAELEPCSPRKKKRLEILRASRGIDIMKKFSQESQESRATSTPTKQTRKTNLSISTDLSSIHSNSEVINNSLSSQSSFESTLVEDMSQLGVRSISRRGSEEESSSTSDIAMAPRLFKGKTWNLLKPKSEGTLYHKILSDLDNIQDVAQDLLNDFHMNEREAVLSVIQLFIDISGFQSEQIKEHLDFDGDFKKSCKKVIKLMEFDLVDDALLQHRTYLVNESEKKKSKIAVGLLSVIRRFLDTFFIGAYGQKILFEDFFDIYIFDFLYYMCQSILRPLRHTGLVLVRIILTAINTIYLRIKSTSQPESGSSGNMTEDEKEQRHIQKYITFLFQTFSRNSFISDYEFCNLRAKNIEEMGDWMITLPEVYFEKCLELLLKLMVDEYEIVRLHSLKVCARLVEKKIIHCCGKRRVTEIIGKVTDRLRDVKLNVVVEAVKIFTLLLNNYLRFIQDVDVLVIADLLYSDDYIYAKAAGSFCSNFFEYAYHDKAQRLRKFIAVSEIPRYAEMKPLYVEGFSEYETVLRDYEYLVKTLLSVLREGRRQYSVNLMELIYHSIYQTLKGESSMKRKHSVTADVLFSHHDLIAQIFLTNLHDLYESFKEEITILNYLIKILCLIDHDVLSSAYQSQYMILMKVCRRLFLNEDNDELLENICTLFRCLYPDKKTISNGNWKVKFLKDLFENTSVYLKAYLKPNPPEVSLDYHFDKIGILYKKFDMNIYFDWSILYSEWPGGLNWKGQMVACTQHIIWSLKDFIKTWDSEDSDGSRMKSITLKTNFSQLTQSLIDVMVEDNDDNLKFQAFECLSLLYATTDKILLQEPGLGELRFNIMENIKEDNSNILVKFFKDKIVNDTSLTSEDRKKYVRNWLTLVLNGIVDLLSIVPLFECYHTRSEEYERLVEYASAQIFAFKHEAFFNVILVTLIELAEKIWKTGKSIIDSESANLMALAGKFSNMKEFNHSSEVTRMIRSGLRYSFGKPSLRFLLLLQNFVRKLSLQDRKQCLQFLDITPDEYRNQKYIVAFKTKLKFGNTGTKGNVTITEGETSTSTLIETEPTRKKKRNSLNLKKKEGKKRLSKTSSGSSKNNSEVKTPIHRHQKNKPVESSSNEVSLTGITTLT